MSKRERWSRIIARWSGYFVDGWLLSLVLGAMHSTYPQVPAIGYWWGVFLAFVFSGIAYSGALGAELTNRTVYK